MKTSDQIAEILYSPSSESAEPMPEPSPEAALAEKLYGPPADNSESPPDDSADTADRLYDNVVGEYQDILRAGIQHLAEQTGLTDEQSATHLKESAQLFRDLGVPASEAAQLHDLFVGNVVNNPSDEQIAEWGISTRVQLKQRFGANTERMVQAARKFVDGRPGLKQLLGVTGLGNHPRVVLALTESAWRGRLKA